jgi:beta-galactosidase beta subunit
MIFTKLKAASLDESLRKRLAIAWQFLRDNDLTAFPDGPTEILPVKSVPISCTIPLYRPAKRPLSPMIVFWIFNT